MEPRYPFSTRFRMSSDASPRRLCRWLPKLGICPGPEVHGIVTFYHDFRQHPAGRSVLKLCLAEAGQSMNGAKIASDLLAALGISWGETISDGHLTVECVYCPALCACAPSALFDGEPVGRISSETLTDLVPQARTQ
jgi:formate dehydrogenase subunit gamma